MIPRIDIFRIDSKDTPLWLCCTDTIDQAKAFIRLLLEAHDAEFMIYDQVTRQKTRFKKGDVV